MTLAMEQGALFRVERRPGDYVVRGSPLVLVWPGSLLTEKIASEVNSAFGLGQQRTSGQDVEFSVNQLVEVAVRSLSPGVNDPFTALACVDRLGSALCRLAQREMPSPHRFDEKNQLRVIAPPVTFSEMADAAFNQIRQYGRSSPATAIRLLDTIATIAPVAHRAEDRTALRRHAEMVVRGSREGLPEFGDRADVETHYQRAARALNEPGELPA
jgi:uncharacterized membrane protein